MKLKFICCLICFAFLLPSCTSTKGTAPSQNKDYTIVGKNLKVKNDNKELALLDNKDALAASGLYYATWVTGTPKAYKNSDGDTVDLYDAQLYLLSGEADDSTEAQKNLDSWLEAARSKYDITNEKMETFNGQEYLIATYNCKGENNPYYQGISAFGISGNNAVCIGLTCRENFGARRFFPYIRCPRLPRQNLRAHNTARCIVCLRPDTTTDARYPRTTSTKKNRRTRRADRTYPKTA